MWEGLWFGVTSVLIAALATLVYLRWRARRWRLLELAARVPGPPALPLLGNALLFMSKPNEQLDLIRGMISKYGEYVRFWLGPELNIIVTNPKDIRLLLSSNKVNQKGPVYEHMKPVIGPGILTGGSVWRNHRKIVTPSYNKRSVAAFSRVFNMEAASLAEKLCARDPRETFNVYWDVVNATTQCVCQTLMGLSKIESQNLTNLDYVVKNTPKMYDFYFGKMTKWWLQIPQIFWLTGSKKVQDNCKKMFYPLFDDILEKRRKALERNEGVDEEVRGIVDRLILSGELNEQQLREETFSLFTTSQEAPAKIASGFLVFLAYFPEWQEKVYNEIQDRLGVDDDFITAEQIKSLQYLDMCFKEVLRLLSICPLIQRRVEQEISIDSGNITLPVGTSLAIPIHILHRSPKYWPDPDKADPERFLPENVKQRDPSVFVPYSLGPMDCLGRVYAVHMIKTLMVRVLRHVRLEAEGRFEDLELEVAISVTLAKGYNLRTIPRKQKTNRMHNVA